VARRLTKLAFVTSVTLTALMAAAWIATQWRGVSVSRHSTFPLTDGHDLSWHRLGATGDGWSWIRRLHNDAIDEDLSHEVHWSVLEMRREHARVFTSGPAAVDLLGFYCARRSITQNAWALHDLIIEVPHWFTTLAPAAAALLTGRSVFRRRPRPGHCPGCGYDLRATRERCPECGRAVGSRLSDH
jgi:hypothetical protein